MKRFLFIGFAACAFALAPILSASAMPVANPNALTDTDSSVVLVRGGHGHGHGWGHHGGRGHHMVGLRPSSSLVNITVIVLIILEEAAPAGGAICLSEIG
jgi:hypothetical protein